jgi:hypothetical protein
VTTPGDALYTNYQVGFGTASPIAACDVLQTFRVGGTPGGTGAPSWAFSMNSDFNHAFQMFAQVNDEITSGVHYPLWVDANPILLNSSGGALVGIGLTIPTGLSASVATGGSLALGLTYYVITAVTANGETLRSAQVAENMNATYRTVNLSWTAYPGATSYKVYRSTTSGSYGATSLAGSPTVTSFTDSGVTDVSLC